MRGDFLGHFVAFEHVLKRADLETVIVGDFQQHQDLVGAIAMSVDEAFAFENLDQRIEFQVAARRDGMFALGHLGAVVVPIRLILLRFVEGFADDVVHAHARGRIAQVRRAENGRRSLALGVLAKGELNAGQRPFERGLERSYPSAF